MTLQTTISKGECEVCGTPDVKLRLQKVGNIMMCESCWADEQNTISQNAKAVIATSQKIDSTIELKADIFNAATTSFTELQTAILSNSEIAADRKNEALLSEVAARIAVLDAAIFQQKAELADNQNKRNSLLTNAQQIHARLRANEQAKFKQFDVSYKPAVAKGAVVKASKGKTARPKTNITLVRQMAEKYGVPASGIQTAVLQHHITPEQAGIYLQKMMNDSMEDAKAYLASVK